MKYSMHFADMINELRILKKFSAVLWFILFVIGLGKVPEDLPPSARINIP